MSNRLFIVFLRQPGKDDWRTDPFWEFGSFGCTGCHGRNLLNPQKKHVDSGDCLAFVQGGPDGCKLLLITPPVKRIEHGTTRVEIRWCKTAKPFRYSSENAPVLAQPGTKNVALVGVGRLVNKANRSTAQAKLASCVRTRCQPLDANAATELFAAYSRARRAATSSDFIQSYADALPRSGLHRSLQDRGRDYQNLLAELSRSHLPSSCRQLKGHRK